MSLNHDADALIARLDLVTHTDGDELQLVSRERGWIEAIQYLAEKGMLTPAGEAEAAKLVAASSEWANGLACDELDTPSSPSDPGDEPVIIAGG